MGGNLVGYAGTTRYKDKGAIGMKFHNTQVPWVREDGTIDQERYNRALANIAARRKARLQPRVRKLPRKNRRQAVAV